MTLSRPAGSVSILPTVLYLLLGVIRELVHQPRNTGNTPADGPGLFSIRAFKATSCRSSLVWWTHQSRHTSRTRPDLDLDCVFSSPGSPGSPGAPGAPGAGSGGGGGPGLVVQAALQALKSVVMCPMSRQEKSRGAWRLLLSSALNTLLGLWDSGTNTRSPVVSFTP